jgi:hypothetical protein
VGWGEVGWGGVGLGFAGRSAEEVKRKHWYQQYNHTRRFVLYGGCDSNGCGLADVWELRLIFDPTRLLIVRVMHYDVL